MTVNKIQCADYSGTGTTYVDPIANSMDATYLQFADALNEWFNDTFVIDGGIWIKAGNSHDLWEHFLSLLPEELRGPYTCSACKQTLMALAGAVELSDKGELIPLFWVDPLEDGEDNDRRLVKDFPVEWAAVNDGMYAYVMSQTTGLVPWTIPSDANHPAGRRVTLCTKPHAGTGREEFNHFYVGKSTIEKLLKSNQHIQGIDHKGLVTSMINTVNKYRELPLPAIVDTLVMIAAAYRSDPLLKPIQAIATYIADTASNVMPRANVANYYRYQLASKTPNLTHLSTSIAIPFLDKVLEGNSVEDALKSVSGMLSPMRYQRSDTSSGITVSDLTRVRERLEKDGVADSFALRPADLSDVPAIWHAKDDSVGPTTAKCSILDTVVASDAPRSTDAVLGTVDGGKISLAHFMTEILPRAVRLQVHLQPWIYPVGFVRPLTDVGDNNIWRTSTPDRPLPVTSYAHNQSVSVDRMSLEPGWNSVTGVIEHISEMGSMGIEDGTAYYDAPEKAASTYDPTKGDGNIFVIKGMRYNDPDYEIRGLMFPETFKHQYHGDRKIIEAMATQLKLFNPNTGSCMGVSVAGVTATRVRVTTAGGTVVEYTINSPK